jgi:hypothetical protein
MLLENVCVWKVQVTYEDATKGTAMLRARGDSTSSWTAQSSMTTLSVSMSTRSVQYTTDGETSYPNPSQSQRRMYMGQPYASHSGKVLRMGLADVNSHVSWTGYEKTRPGGLLSVAVAVASGRRDS